MDYLHRDFTIGTYILHERIYDHTFNIGDKFIYSAIMSIYIIKVKGKLKNIQSSSKMFKQSSGSANYLPTIL